MGLAVRSWGTRPFSADLPAEDLGAQALLVPVLLGPQWPILPCSEWEGLSQDPTVGVSWGQTGPGNPAPPNSVSGVQSTNSSPGHSGP